MNIIKCATKPFPSPTSYGPKERRWQVPHPAMTAELSQTKDSDPREYLLLSLWWRWSVHRSASITQTSLSVFLPAYQVRSGKSSVSQRLTCGGSRRRLESRPSPIWGRVSDSCQAGWWPCCCLSLEVMYTLRRWWVGTPSWQEAHLGWVILCDKLKGQQGTQTFGPTWLWVCLMVFSDAVNT